MDVQGIKDTIQELIHEIKNYIFQSHDHFGQSQDSSFNASFGDLINLGTSTAVFPGLRGDIKTSVDEDYDDNEGKGIQEIVMLQQRTVLQVGCKVLNGVGILLNYRVPCFRLWIVFVCASIDLSTTLNSLLVKSDASSASSIRLSTS